MARQNTKVVGAQKVTHEGASAFSHLTSLQSLRRSVLACFLWEDQFYENGVDIADRIRLAAQGVSAEDLAALAIEARHQFNLRHVPLFLLAILAQRASGRPDGLVRKTIAQVISRADELAEFLAIYWKENGRLSISVDKKKLSGQVKKGLAAAFAKFDAYSLAKYNRDNEVKLRDVMFLAHPKPKDAIQTTTFNALAAKMLEAPDTWEVALSAGADKKETFERLIKEGKLGYLAFLRNLRNMIQADVDPALIKQAIVKRAGGAEKVLPFRFIAAARYAVQFEPELDKSMVAAIHALPSMSGKTLVLVDVSGSMDAPMSTLRAGKMRQSDMLRVDAAAALAVFVQGDRRVFTFSQDVVEVPPRAGMAGIEAVKNSQPHGGTYLGKAVAKLNAIPHDRLIIITDEQSADKVPDPVAAHAYMINVGSYENGIGYGPKWTHISGFSEQIFRYIAEIEAISRG